MELALEALHEGPQHDEEVLALLGLLLTGLRRVEVSDTKNCLGHLEFAGPELQQLGRIRVELEVHVGAHRVQMHNVVELGV